jgi:glucose-6-phosphate isomerase, archaeal
MKYYPGFDIEIIANPMGFRYGHGVFGPPVENRSLDAIRNSLLDPDCEGPDPVYSIAMDVGKFIHRQDLIEKNLLFGIVTYSEGRLGNEPVRSQGHVHKIARNNRMSPPEIYEIWAGRAIIYMQEYAGDNPGRCFAVEAGPGEVVIVPPDWAHATISADDSEQLTFGAWCDRNFGFDYDLVRAHKGLAWYPVYTDSGKISWKANSHYLPSNLMQKIPGNHPELGLKQGVPIYTIFEENPDAFLYMANPELKKSYWENFVP